MTHINTQATPPVALGKDTLSELPDNIIKPQYNRSQLSPGIVHIGLGNFHRAHQAWYLQQLLQRGRATDWAIVGAGIRPYDEVQRSKLAAQDYLTTLIELDPSGHAVEIVGSMIDYIEVQADNKPLITQMADPAIRIVALTVTEGGYYINPTTQTFDANHPDILHDAQNPTTPCTAFGAIIAALRLRHDNNISPFTGLCCDNLQGNGDILRSTVVSLARLTDPAFADWINTHCSFPNSMVDCIVPATGDNEINLAKSFGIDDAAPVTHERFRQWVIEDKFCNDRPDWDLAGATFTDAVHDYETMKIRILNAGHQVLANAGELLGMETIADCMANPLIADMFNKVENEEIAPYVKPVPDMTPSAYVKLIAERFANPAILDTTRRVAFDGSSRHTGFVLPILRDALAADASIEGLSLVEALWARMCDGTREDGTVIEPNDPFWEEINAVAKRAKAEPMLWLQQQNTYGDLQNNQHFSESFCHWLTQLWDDGVAATLKAYPAA
jgi:mannitol 2-dehydrogenase